MYTTSTPATAHADHSPTATGSVLPDERRMLFGGVLLGIAYLIGFAFIMVFFATSHPAIDATPQEAARGFSDAADMVGIGTWLALLPLPFGLLFLGGLAAVVRRHDGDAAATVSLAAGVTTLVFTALGGIVSAVTPAIGAEDVSPAAGAVVKALDGVMPLSLAASGFPRAVLIVVAVLALSRVGLVGRGLRGFSWALAGLSVLGTATFLAQGFFPLAALGGLLFAAWVASVAVVLRRRPA